MSVQITRILVYEYEEYEVFFYECIKYSNFRLRVRGVRGIFYECTKYPNFRLRVRGVRGSKNFVQNYLLKINLVYSSRLRVRDNSSRVYEFL